MEKKINLKKVLAVCLCMMFAWIAVALWFFDYEIANYIHCAKEIPECVAIVFACLGMSFSCLAYSKKDADNT